LCLCGESSAALDPESKTPYHIRIVLQVADHRMLTAQFQKHLEGDIRDQLQLALGKLAQVEVVRGHARISDIRAKGLQAVLNNWDELSSAQTHFVLIDFADGKYHIQTGQHDGMTGVSSSNVRRQTLSDRQLVADAAVQMIRKDFGVIGTFQELKGKEVTLTIKGGGLVDSLEPWLKRGDVFTVVRISEASGKTRANPIDQAVLEVVELLPGGQARCRYFCRYALDRELRDAKPVSGYRCIKLSTITAPVQVRLVNKETYEFINGLSVEISATDSFKGALKKVTTLDKGLFKSSTTFSNVAYVRIWSGASLLVEFPLALVDDRVVVCWMSPKKNLMDQGDVELRKEHWVRWCIEALSLTDQRLSELNAELTPEEALKLGQESKDAIAADWTRLETERNHLLELAKKQKMGLDLSVGEQFTAALTKRLDQLNKYLDELDKLIKEANSEERKELIAKVKRAELLEKQAEFDKALELYEQVLKSPNTAEVKARADQLKAEWQIKNKEHGDARLFLYETWPKLDLSELQAKLGKARESFKVCKEAGDRLTPLKLQLVNIQHATALVQELEVLRKAPDSQDNHQKLRTMHELATDLRSLQTEVTAWIAKEK